MFHWPEAVVRLAFGGEESSAGTSSAIDKPLRLDAPCTRVLAAPTQAGERTGVTGARSGVEGDPGSLGGAANGFAASLSLVVSAGAG